MDLLFPHHESEVCQSTVANGIASVRYWLHNNMITINGQKMGKSLGNFITLDEFFQGTHSMLSQAFDPMTIRFFMLQAHYRSTLDFSNEALLAAEKGMHKLMEAYDTLKKIKPSQTNTNPESFAEVDRLFQTCLQAMNDDFNSPIATLFDAGRIINAAYAGKLSLAQENIEKLTHLFDTFLFDILGMSVDNEKSTTKNLEDDLMQLILSLRSQAKERKDYTSAAGIRQALQAIGITIKDTKDGVEWSK